ncbi:GL13179 [Drosophila persimilis]|uniref:GL13179 n=1 Tax=Drosophila persimilis TaxID=7234 RepID=B4IRQ2_DROPE|nr:GL13179 [Drosophila persimilis]
MQQQHQQMQLQKQSPISRRLSFYCTSSAASPAPPTLVSSPPAIPFVPQPPLGVTQWRVK